MEGQNGKGSLRRKQQVSDETFTENWMRAFGKKDKDKNTDASAKERSANSPQRSTGNTQ